MRLLKVPDSGLGNVLPELVDFPPDRIPSYAILSHRWGAPSDEVLFVDMMQYGSCRTAEVLTKKGFAKVQYCCTQALEDGLGFVWVRKKLLETIH